MSDYDYPEVECPPGQEMDQECLANRKAEYKRSMRSYRSSHVNQLGQIQQEHQAAYDACHSPNGYYHPAQTRACRARAAQEHGAKMSARRFAHKQALSTARNLERNGCRSACCQDIPEEGEDQ